MTRDRDPKIVVNDEFLAEATEIVERLQTGVVELDEGNRAGAVSPSLLNDVFRAAHSLKGLAGIFGVDTLVSLAHEFEDLLHGLRLGRIELDSSVISLLYTTGDAFSQVLQALRSSTPQDSEALANLAAKLKAHADGTVLVPTTSLQDLGLPEGMLAVLTEYEEHRLNESVRAGKPLFVIETTFALSNFDQELGDLAKRLSSRGEILTTLPSTSLTPGHIAFKLLFCTNEPAESWQQALEALPDAYQLSELTKNAVVTHKTVVAQDANEPAAVADVGTAVLHDTIRVDIRKLDNLMNVVGELALVRADIAHVLAELAPMTGTQRVSLDLRKIERAFERHVRELQLGIMNVRMVPLRVVFDRLSRSVRRLAHDSGKEVRFIVGGEETELDKVIVEELSDPLMHLVRNSMDHGLESSEARELQGKSPVGNISVRAYPKGRHVVIAVSDDGSGLDDVAIRRIALERGLVDEERVGLLTRRELWNFIFNAGFSTRREVSEVSGRGVGMDVVKTNISRLSGVIDVDSAPGKGTTFTITLPITLAIVQALVVESAGVTFALPLSSVIEIRALDDASLRSIEGRRVMFGKDETIPLTWLNEVFQLSQEAPQPEQRHVVVVGLAQNRLGIVVDELLGQQDIIIKPLGKLLRRVPGVAGATDLGSGQLVLVLDVGELVQESLVVPMAAVG